MDGRVGRATVRALADYVRDNGKDIFITRFCAGWLAYLKGRRGWKRYGRGWSRRVEEVREVALVMAKRDKASDFDRPIKPAPQRSLWSALAEFINSIFRENYR